jgi:2-haloacid dehalogenase/putative hydrolase of the HAD superfamily
VSADVRRADTFSASVGTWPPFADTVETLRCLKRFYKLAILSNVDRGSVARTLQRLEVSFDLVVTAEDVGSCKPARPHFERVAARLAGLGIDRTAILHVAQSKHHDIGPGRELGLTCVWVDRRAGKRGSGATLAAEAKPHLSVGSLAELLALIRAQRDFGLADRRRGGAVLP